MVEKWGGEPEGPAEEIQVSRSGTVLNSRNRPDRRWHPETLDLCGCGRGIMIRTTEDHVIKEMKEFSMIESTVRITGPVLKDALGRQGDLLSEWKQSP